jgi:hypothetical protein
MVKTVKLGIFTTDDSRLATETCLVCITSVVSYEDVGNKLYIYSDHCTV